MSASASTASSSLFNGHVTYPRHRRADNDSIDGRTRRLHVEIGMSHGDSLPPSTGSFRSINVERVERGHKFIASSISDLARQHFL